MIQETRLTAVIHFRNAPHPGLLPIRWGEGGRRPGEGFARFYPEICFGNCSKARRPENPAKIGAKDFLAASETATHWSPSSIRRNRLCWTGQPVRTTVPTRCVPMRRLLAKDHAQGASRR